MKKNNEIGASPLLQNGSNSVDGIKSTVHPEKLDQVRFSERKQNENDGNSVRILVYFLVVVVLGAGAAFGIQRLISENETNNIDNETSDTKQEVSAYDINTAELLNSTAVDVPSKEDLTDASLTTVGIQSNSGAVNEVEYRNYETFNRVILRIDATQTPKTEVTLDTTKRLLTIKLPQGVTVAEGLKQGASVGTTLSNIFFDDVENSFQLQMIDEIFYRVKVSGVDLIIDFATESELNIESPQNSMDEPVDSNVEEDEDSDSFDDESNMLDPNEDDLSFDENNFTNEFSQKKQYIVNTELQENKIYLNTYYFYDEGSFFEFSIGQYGLTGEENTPNSYAELVTENGQNYILWTVENLQASPDAKLTRVTAEDIAQTINMAGANFQYFELESYENGKATFKVMLKNKADFKLLAQESYEGKTQLISLQIRD
ncbi:MAG: hypothetical protein KatS3mg085_785 [Candidatus Dojkabacteria bacterium]|nr:MAG: hypothetical protein KatS3mg085_785 [Candidatus Dojkabacteria bacterium]